MSDPIIQVKDVDFSYQSTTGGYATTPGEEAQRPVIHALSDLSFACSPGTITLICGASGSGKSTALRLINGLVPHFNEGVLTGEVIVQGEAIPDAPLADLGTHSETVFQNPRTQFFTSEVMSELAFRGENWGLDPAIILDQVAAAAREVGIEDLLEKRLDSLSGGQLQKIACAQALTPGTAILLFDEPTSNLSPEAIDAFRDLLVRLKDQGHTIVVAEHRVYFLRDLADQVFIMADGRISHQLDGASFYEMAEAERLNLGLRTLEDPRTPVTTPRDEVLPAQGLHLQTLTYSYGQEPVLTIDDAVFASGRITALTGDNGVGKSTLARVICGLAKPAKGSLISLAGHPLGAAKRLASTALVMQDVHRQLFGESVLAEVLIGREGEGDHEDEIRILTELGLEHTLDRHPLSLSGGQKQRLVIASAVVADKAIYIFDEPTSGVDYRHLHGIAQQMRLLADNGAVVIVITHDPELIATCADDIAVMRAARTLEAGDGQIHFYRNPHIRSFHKGEHT